MFQYLHFVQCKYCLYSNTSKEFRCVSAPPPVQRMFILFVFLPRTVHKHLNQGLPSGNTGPNAPLSSVAKEHHLAVARALWRNFFPFLKSQRMLQTPCSQLADTAAGLYSSLAILLYILGTVLYLL